MKYSAFAILILFLAGCSTENGPRTLADYRKEFPQTVTLPELRDGPLSLSQARKTALKNNPDYISAYYSIRAAKYAYYRTLGAYLPSVNYDASVGQSLTWNPDRHNPPVSIERQENKVAFRNTVGASWLIFDGLEREFNVLIAKKEFKRSGLLDENVKRLLLRAVAYAYLDAILADEKYRIAEADFAFQGSSLAQAENRYLHGHVSKAAVLNFKILANSARSSMATAKYQSLAARYSLYALMGLSENVPGKLELTPLQIKTPEKPFPLNYYLETAVANRPDLKNMKLLLEISGYREYSAWSGFMPTLFAEAGYGFGTDAMRYHGADYNRSYYNSSSFGYGIRGGWNLFDGFSTVNRIRSRMFEKTAARFQLEKSFLDVVNEVKTAYVNYLNSMEQVEIYRETMQWVFEQRRLVTVSYWAGNDTITRLNGAQSDLVNAESMLAIEMVNLNKAIAQLDAVVNAEIPEEVLREYPHPASGTPLGKMIQALQNLYPPY